MRASRGSTASAGAVCDLAAFRFLTSPPHRPLIHQEGAPHQLFRMAMEYGFRTDRTKKSCRAPHRSVNVPS